MNRTGVVFAVATVACLGLAGLLLVTQMNRTYERAGAVPWPYGLGPLTAAPERFPATEINAAAAQFARLASELKPPDEVRDYLRSEMERGDGMVGAPPAAVTAYLMQHEARLNAIRDHLLEAGPLVWAHDPTKGFESPRVNLPMHLATARLLLIRALQRLEWDELRAASRLAPPLLQRPELVPVMIGVTILRYTAAVAAKLPPPGPLWLEELWRIDPEAALTRAYQFETWLIWTWGNDLPRRVMAANHVRNQREALQLFDAGRCPAGAAAHFARRMEKIPQWNVIGRVAAPSIGSFWDRTIRYRVEREATRNVLRAAAGMPIVAASSCAGTWSSETLPDGRLRIAYSRDIPLAGEEQVAIPLVRITPVRTTLRST